MIDDDRAMSDLIGFVVIITVMLASIGLVATVGFEAVGDVRDGHALNSAQDGMTVIADQLTGIADHHSPARAAEFRLTDARVAVVDGSTVNVTVAYADGTNVTETIQLRSLEYQTDDGTIALVGGAIIREEDGGSVMIRDPPWQCTGSQARINLIRVAPRGDAVVTGEGTIQVQSRHERTRMHHPLNRTLLRAGESVTISFVDGDPPAAWDRHFEADPAWTVTEAGYVCEPPDGAGLIVRSTRVSIGFIR